LKGAIHGWFKRFEAPTETDDHAAVGLFQSEKEELEKLRTVLSAAELEDFGLERIKRVALHASKILKLDRTRSRPEPEQ
jgi:hypothetical protein